MTEDNWNEPRLVLTEFMNEMNAWETKYYHLFKNEARAKHEANASIELSGIFERWCHPKSGSRNRLASLDCSDPPEYEPDGRTIAGVSATAPNIAFDVIQTTGLKSKFKFSLKKTKEGWKISKKEIFTYDGKWKNGGL